MQYYISPKLDICKSLLGVSLKQKTIFRHKMKSNWIYNCNLKCFQYSWLNLNRCLFIYWIIYHSRAAASQNIMKQGQHMQSLWYKNNKAGSAFIWHCNFLALLNACNWIVYIFYKYKISLGLLNMLLAVRGVFQYKEVWLPSLK